MIEEDEETRQKTSECCKMYASGISGETNLEYAIKLHMKKLTSFIIVDDHVMH